MRFPFLPPEEKGNRKGGDIRRDFSPRLILGGGRGKKKKNKRLPFNHYSYEAPKKEEGRQKKEKRRAE